MAGELNPALVLTSQVVLEDQSVRVEIIAVPESPEGEIIISLSGVPASWGVSGVGTYNPMTGVWSISRGPGERFDDGPTLAPPADSDVDVLDLTVTVTESNAVTGESGESTKLIDVIVDAVADTPMLTANNISVLAGGSVALSVSAAPSDTDGSENISGYEILNVPDGYTFSAGTFEGGGVWSFTPSEISSGVQLNAPFGAPTTLNLTARATSTETPSDLDFLNTNDSATASQSFSVTVMNNPPTLALVDSAGSALEGFDTSVDSAAVLNDLDGDADWDGGSLTIQITSGAESGDFVLISGAPTVSFNGTNVSYLGTVIGTSNITGGAANGDPFTITFNSQATNDAVQALLRAINFRVTDQDPTTGTRTITVTATDGNGDMATDARSFFVVPINDEPAFMATATDPAFNEGDGAVTLFTAVGANTIEAGQNFRTIDFEITNVSDGADEKIFFDGTEIALTHNNVGQTTSNYDYSVAVSGATATLAISPGAAMSIPSNALAGLVAAMTYENTSVAPTDGGRAITITSITDDGGVAIGGDPQAQPNITSTVTVSSSNVPPMAFDDIFNILENATDSGQNAFFANIFDDNGNGADSDGDMDAFSVTEINGVAQTPSSFNNVEVNFATGSDAFINVDTGTLGFFLDGNYDFLPVGVSRTESFTYTIDDGNGGTDTATVNITITGVDSNDRVVGTNGNDRLFGGIGNDIVIGGNGLDRLDGGTGNDRLLGGIDNDLLIGRDGKDALYGQNGVDRLFGLDGRDFLYGGNQNDLVRAGAGNDLVFGESGNDKLYGELGNDWIVGGLGRDLLIGGTGRDRFDFDSTRESTGAARDRIFDFTSRQDKIDVSTIDADIAAGGNQRFSFIGEDAFSRTAGELRYKQIGNNVRVEADVTGNGRADMLIDVLRTTDLSAGDFIL